MTNSDRGASNGSPQAALPAPPTSVDTQLGTAPGERFPLSGMTILLLLIACTALILHALAADAACVGGGVSTQPAPAVTLLRAYRAGFDAPTRMAVDASGNIYLTDPQNGQVVVRAPSGHIIARATGLGYPVGVAVDAGGRIYVSDQAAGNVTVFGSDWQQQLMFGQGNGEFLSPTALAIDPGSGNVYVSDSKANLVKVYSSAGVFLSSFGGMGSGAGQFVFPAGIFVDVTAQQVFVVDQLNYRIQVFDLSGNFLFCLGSKGSGPGRFNMPQGVWVDAQRVYVTDSFEGRVQILDRSGNFIAYVGDFGDGPGLLRLPMDVLVDAFNRLFVASANNARLEVFGLDAFTDPETIIPAGITIEPNPLERARPHPVIIAYIEVPGYPLDQILVSSVSANGVVADPSTSTVGDHDGNGVPDLRVEFDWALLTATLPPNSQAVIQIGGTLGNKQLEGSAVVQLLACSPGTVCSIGSADPQCSDAVCIEPIGCVIQPKADGTGCDDSNACTVNDSCGAGVCVGGPPLNCDDGNVCTDDACDPLLGCVHVNNAAPCDDADACTTNDTCSGGTCIGGPPPNCDDLNLCTDDSCDPLLGCVHVNNAAPCDDANACTTNDTCGGGTCIGGPPPNCDDLNLCTTDNCDPASGCVHTNNTVPCDDLDPGTIRDTCNGTGQCVGQIVTGNYVILTWPSAADGAVSLDWRARVGGTICVTTLNARPYVSIGGDVLATQSVTPAANFLRGTRVGGNLITGGGAITGLANVTVGGRVDTSGTAGELDACAAARYRATSRRAEFAALTPRLGFALGSLKVQRRTNQRLPAVGTFGAGQVVVDASDISLAAFAKLTLVGDPSTTAVIVRVSGPMQVGYAAAVKTEGLTPEQVIFAVDGPVTLGPYASLAGTVVAADRIWVGWSSRIDGALLSDSDINLRPWVTVNPHPFAWW